MGGFYYAIYFLYSAVATVDHFKINSAKIMFIFFFFTDQLLLSFFMWKFLLVFETELSSVTQANEELTVSLRVTVFILPQPG